MQRMIGRFPILYIAEADAEQAVLSSGVLSHLVDSLPQARFTVVGSAASAPLFADTPRLDELLVLEREGHFEWLALWNQVRATKWGLVVDMRGSALSGKLRRQKRAVRGKDQPGLHAVEAAARVMLAAQPDATEGEAAAEVVRMLGLEAAAGPAVAARLAMLAGAGTLSFAG
jgi:ADP-heptose:LPS heptosyltransferase